MEAPTNIGEYDSNHMRAWFVAPETTRYRFYMTCDDICEIRFSNKSGSVETADVNVILKQDRWTPYRRYFWNISGTPMNSGWHSLTKGEKYYIEARHSEATGGDHLTIGVEIEKADTTGHHHAMKELQYIGVLTTQQFEEFNVTVNKPDEGEYLMAFRSPTNQTLMPQTKVKANANANTFRLAIN